VSNAGERPVDSLDLPDDTPIVEIAVVGVGVVAVLVLVRHLAVRRVIARQGRFVWLVFAPTLIASVAVVLIGIWTVGRLPFGGAAMILVGGLYLLIVVRFLAHLSGSVSSTAPEANLVTAITPALTEYFTTMAAVILIGGLLVVAGLILWGISNAAT
jgi:hypothetical protein